MTDPLDAGVQFDGLADFCRQLAPRLGHLSSRLAAVERGPVRDLRQVMRAFG
jgi:hypothetical protein